MEAGQQKTQSAAAGEDGQSGKLGLGEGPDTPVGVEHVAGLGYVEILAVFKTPGVEADAQIISESMEMMASSA